MDSLLLGKNYERHGLAELWDYASFKAIARGIVTPKNDNKIILFITKEKQKVQTQYADYFEGDVLNIEGDQGHGNDNRVVSSRNAGDEIYLFYRESHHHDFTYYGLIELLGHKLLTDKPSKFSFKTAKSEVDGGRFS